MVHILKKRWRLLATLLLTLLILGYLAGSLMIGNSVRQTLVEAQNRFPGDPVSALLDVVECPHLTLEQRNRAVWALGQLGDPRALPVLEGLATEQGCDHATDLCRHEVAKAVKLCRGALNITAFVWRRGGPSNG